MSTLGVLAQIQKEHDAELEARSHKDLLGREMDDSPMQGNKYKLALKKKGTSSILRAALQEGSDPEELKLLRQLKFVRGQ